MHLYTASHVTQPFNPRPHMLFPILERTWGVATPHVISPLYEIELWDDNQTNHWDVLSPMVPEVTSLGHILTLQGRVKVKQITI